MRKFLLGLLVALSFSAIGAMTVPVVLRTSSLFNLPGNSGTATPVTKASSQTWADLTNCSTAAGGLQTLGSYTLPAGAYPDTKAVRITAFWRIAGTAGGKSVNLQANGTTICNTGPATSTANLVWQQATLFKEPGLSNQQSSYCAAISNSTASTPPQRQAVGITDGSAITITAKSSTGAVASEVCLAHMLVEYIN